MYVVQNFTQQISITNFSTTNLVVLNLTHMYFLDFALIWVRFALTIEKYPSRDKFEMAHYNVSLVKFCTIIIFRTNLYYPPKMRVVQKFTQPISRY